MYTQFDSVYDGFMEIARNGISIITDLKLTKKLQLQLKKFVQKLNYLQ